MAAARGKRRAVAPSCEDRSPGKRVKLASYSDDDEDNYSVSEADGLDSDASDDNEAATSITAPTPKSASSRSSSSSRRPKIYTCTYEGCTKAFDRPSRLTEHLRTHTNERPFACPHEGCEKAFLKSKHLKRHIEDNHSTERRYVCTWEGCWKAFTTGTVLRRHIETHESKFYCTDYPPCKEVFRRANTLQAHIDKVHLNRKPYPCTLIDPETNLPCTYAYDQEGGLRKHQAKYHCPPQYKCTLCVGSAALAQMAGADPGKEVAFKTFQQLQAHIKAVHPPTCPHCNETFRSSGEVEKHIEAEHNPNGPPVPEYKFFCQEPDCGAKFTKNSNLKTHMNAVHDQSQKFVCGEFDLTKFSRFGEVVEWGGSDSCGRGFGTRSHLEEHVKTVHLGLESAKMARKRKAQQKERRLALGLAQGQVEEPSALARLTGIEYMEDYDYDSMNCFAHYCKARFTTDKALSKHCIEKHGMTESEISELLLQRHALAGGQFWISGEAEVKDDPDGYAEEQERSPFPWDDLEATSSAMTNGQADRAGQDTMNDDVAVDPALLDGEQAMLDPLLSYLGAEQTG